MKIEQIQVEKRLVPSDKDDLRHTLRKSAVARESTPYIVVLPEDRITAFVYTWVSAEGKAGSACCIFGPGVGEEPILEVVDGISVPADMDFTDWKVGDIRIQHRKTLAVADVLFTGKRIGFDMHFEAIHPAYSYSGHPDGCPSDVADDRFEQSGLVTGTLTIDGRRIPFNTTGHRDHSWGTRDWTAIQHWKWFEGQCGPDMAVHFFEILCEGKRHLRGYIYKEGLMSEVNSLEVDFEHAADLKHKSMDAVVGDLAGRKVRVTGRTFAMNPFQASPTTVLNQAGMAVEFDGISGVGWLEMCWPKAYVDYMGSRNK